MSIMIMNYTQGTVYMYVARVTQPFNRHTLFENITCINS